MNPGDLKERIKIMEPTYTDSEYGGQELNQPEQWNEVTTVWAAYRDLSGNEFFSSRQTNPKLTGEFKIRYRGDIKPHYKIIFGARIFDIAGPPRDVTGRTEWLYINAEEVFG
jgi:SPP1 family predicted phage head-tail adaptor